VGEILARKGFAQEMIVDYYAEDAAAGRMSGDLVRAAAPPITSMIEWGVRLVRCGSNQTGAGAAGSTLPVNY